MLTLALLAGAPPLIVQTPRAHAAGFNATVCAAGCDYTAIQPAIDAALRSSLGVNTGNTITIGSGTYLGTLTFGSQGLGYYPNFTLRAAPSTSVTLDGGGTGPVIVAGAAGQNPPTVIIQGVTIQNGHAVPDNAGNPLGLGGGLRIANGATVTLQNDLVLNNSAMSGAGASVVSATLNVYNSTFKFNAASGGDSAGGGIYALGSTITIKGSAFLGNDAQGGPGHAGSDGAAGANGADNTSLPAGQGKPAGDGLSGGMGQGGALAANGGSVTIDTSTFNGNRASGGTGGTGGAGGAGGNGGVGADGQNTGAGSYGSPGGAGGDGGAGGAGGQGGQGGDGFGGAIFALTRLTVTQSTFSNNQIQAGNGGAGGKGGAGGAGGAGGHSGCDLNGYGALCAMGGNGGNGGSGGYGGIGGDTGLASGGAVSILSPGTAVLANDTFSGNDAASNSGGAGASGGTKGAGGAAGTAGVYNDFPGAAGIDGSTGATGAAGTSGGSGWGGAIEDISTSGGVMLYNDTIANNHLSQGGAGTGISGPVSLGNTIVAGASGASCATRTGQAQTDLGGNLQTDTSCGATILVGNPELGPLQNNGGPTQTMAPSRSPLATYLATSGLLSICQNAWVGGVDQRGYVRPQGSCAIGAEDNTATMYRVCPDQPSALSAYANAVLTDAPLGYWRLDGPATSTCVADSSGHNQIGQAQGGVKAGAAGALAGDTALSFDGTSGYVSLGDPAILQPSQVSVEAWVNTTNQAAETVVRKRGYGYDLGLAGDGQPVFSIVDSNTVPYSVTGSWPVNDGRWHHLVGTYDGKQVCLYVDGVQAAGCSPAGTIFYNPDLVAIGRDGGYAGGYFNGLIDDVAIYGMALAGARVQAHYLASGQMTAHAALQQATRPWNAATSITGTGFAANEQVNAYWGYTGGALLGSATASRSGALTISFVTPPVANGTYLVILAGQTSHLLAGASYQVTTQYAQVVLADQPLGYWRLDEPVAGKVGDHGVNGLAGQTQGGVLPGVTGATSDGDTAMAFDGSSGYISLGDPAILQSKQVSVEAWVNTTSQTTQVVVRKRGYGYVLVVGSNGQPIFGIDDASATLYSVTGSQAVNDGQWHHLVGTYDGSQVCLYVDGVQAGACQKAGTIFYSADLVAIGRDGGFAGNYFNGTIDEVAIYGKALTAAQVQRHFLAR
jgi:hypothetical protein